MVLGICPVKTIFMQTVSAWIANIEIQWCKPTDKPNKLLMIALHLHTFLEHLQEHTCEGTLRQTVRQRNVFEIPCPFPAEYI